MMKVWMAIAAMLALTACTESVPQSGAARFLAMGDSLLAVHSGTRNSVSHQLEARLGEQVIDRSVVGARYLYPLPVSGRLGLRISSQYRPGKWDWVILNGGGNDLWLACGCRRCDGQLDRLISEDGRVGAITDVVARARASGAKVLYVGYLRSPGVPSSIDHCAAYGDELEARVARLAEIDPGITFLSLKDLVPYGDRSFHDTDMIHPSRKGSAAIAARIAKVVGDDP